ncbi:helix-turn-helix transcriptional regulator [Mesorhizobium sp. L-8-3]|uniref:helix-turn-helix transcriptional regulator n=1 Tax=Mesorhizobium sp. L-8-3 TaxID=2744522 RepID=UPI001927060D|nr:LuxR family transcriptional regulator [Mesorhizobium sp. L-8-3]BCH27874.1 histidine kinase [Mesorhizobium sp. L-8-3]
MIRRAHADTDVELLDMLEEIDELLDAAEISTLLAKLLDVYDLKSVAYLGVGLTDRPDDGPYLAVTYSPEWIDHYKAEHFVDVDPAIQVGLRRMLPIDWSEFDRHEQTVRRLFGEAGEFGLGRHGISLPVHGRHGDRALVSITSNASTRDWQRLRLAYMRDFQLIALHMHWAIVRLEGNHIADTAALSRRERECLRWIAEGKTHWECATILGIAERTVRCYLESARHKLGAANSTHAVNRAGKASLLSELP